VEEDKDGTEGDDALTLVIVALVDRDVRTDGLVLAVDEDPETEL
jgi:hypothetical protein